MYSEFTVFSFLVQSAPKDGLRPSEVVRTENIELPQYVKLAVGFTVKAMAST